MYITMGLGTFFKKLRPKSTQSPSAASARPSSSRSPLESMIAKANARANGGTNANNWLLKNFSAENNKFLGGNLPNNSKLLKPLHRSHPNSTHARHMNKLWNDYSAILNNWGKQRASTRRFATPTPRRARQSSVPTLSAPRRTVNRTPVPVPVSVSVSRNAKAPNSKEPNRYTSSSKPPRPPPKSSRPTNPPKSKSKRAYEWNAPMVMMR